MTKISFNILKDYALNIMVGAPVRQLLRSNEMQKKYDLFKEKTDLHNNIMNTSLKNNNYKLEKNKFPLDLEPHIDQYVLWMRPEIKLDLPNYIRTQFGTKKTVYWENPDKFKSIPTIKHYHIFVENTASKL